MSEEQCLLRGDRKPNPYYVGWARTEVMSLSAAVRRWLTDEDGLVYECRNCGTTLEATDQQCSTCGSTEIVVFDVS